MRDHAAPERVTRRIPRWIFRFPELIFRLRLGFLAPWWLMLVTTGRRSGRPRRVVLDVIRRDDGRLWIIAADGRRADFVRNIEADPRVEVWHRGSRHRATARPLEEADAAIFAVDLYRRRPGYLRAVYRMLGERIESEEDVRRLASATLPIQLRLED